MPAESFDDLYKSHRRTAGLLGWMWSVDHSVNGTKGDERGWSITTGKGSCHSRNIQLSMFSLLTSSRIIMVIHSIAARYPALRSGGSGTQQISISSPRSLTLRGFSDALQLGDGFGDVGTFDCDLSCKGKQGLGSGGAINDDGDRVANDGVGHADLVAFRCEGAATNCLPNSFCHRVCLS